MEQYVFPRPQPEPPASVATQVDMDSAGGEAAARVREEDESGHAGGLKGKLDAAVDEWQANQKAHWRRLLRPLRRVNWNAFWSPFNTEADQVFLIW